MFSFLGPLIGAATNLFGMKQQKDQQEDALAWQQANWQQNADLQREFWDKNAALQREFAQSGIRWRVEDAKAAGIHPLFSLSGGGAAFSPQSVSVDGGGSYPSNNSGEYLSRMGQDISRAISATQTKDERENDMIAKLSLERAGLENELLKAQITKTLAMANPPMPRLKPEGTFTPHVDSISGPMGVYEPKAPEVTNADPANRAIVAGPAMPYTQFTYTGSGLLGMPNKDVGGLDDIDGSNPYGLEHSIRNRVLPFIGTETLKPPLSKVREHWPNATGSYFDRFYLEWRPLFHNKSRPNRMKIEVQKLPPPAKEEPWYKKWIPRFSYTPE